MKVYDSRSKKPPVEMCDTEVNSFVPFVYLNGQLMTLVETAPRSGEYRVRSDALIEFSDDDAHKSITFNRKVMDAFIHLKKTGDIALFIEETEKELRENVRLLEDLQRRRKLYGEKTR